MATSNGSAALSLTADERPLVFVSYSKDDRSWLDDHLLRHLGGARAGRTDHLVAPILDIDPGVNGCRTSSRPWRDAEVAVCLISANYLTTAFCVKEEIPYLLERQSKDGLEIVFVLLSPVNLEPHPLAQQPTDAAPQR